MSDLVKTIILVLAVTAVCAGAPSQSKNVSQQESSEPATPSTDKTWLKHIDPKEAHALLQKKEAPLVLDIRTAFEYKGGFIKGARLVDCYSKNFKEDLAKFDRGKMVIVHCRSGGRSTRNLPLFKKLGFKKVYHLDGGILAWEKAGYPLTRNRE